MKGVGENLLLLLLCAALLACGSSGNQTINTSGTTNSTPLATAPSPTPSAVSAKPEIVPLQTPERITSGTLTESDGGWNEAVQKITYQTSADNSQQPALFYAPKTDEPRPLLVGLHSWSADYMQDSSAIYAEWAIANDWVFIHPNFRGNNESPETTGSELVVKDVISAVDYAK